MRLRSPRQTAAVLRHIAVAFGGQAASAFSCRRSRPKKEHQPAGLARLKPKHRSTTWTAKSTPSRKTEARSNSVLVPRLQQGPAEVPVHYVDSATKGDAKPTASAKPGRPTQGARLLRLRVLFSKLNLGLTPTEKRKHIYCLRLRVLFWFSCRDAQKYGV